MKNTYINDQELVNYPFAEGQVLPFPKGAVAGLSLCFMSPWQDAPWSVQSITVTGVEIGGGQITLTLCVNGSTYLGRLTAASRSSASFNVPLNQSTHMHAMLEAGNLDSIQSMSAACELHLDPSCITGVQGRHYDNTEYANLIVNGYEYPVGECLDIQVAGALTAQSTFAYNYDQYGEPTTVIPSAVYFDVEGWLAAGSGAFVMSQLGTYDMVTSINGVAVRGTPTDPKPKLMFRVIPLNSEPAATATMRRIKFGIVNGLTTAQIAEDRLHVGPNKLLEGFNDLMGSGTVLTVTGGPLVPNCYGSTDESASPDDPTINAPQGV